MIDGNEVHKKFCRICVISKENTFEVRDLRTHATNHGIDLITYDVTDVHRRDHACDVVYWRSATVTKQYPKLIGRTLVQADIICHVPLVNSVHVHAPHLVNKSIQQLHFENYCGALGQNIAPILTYMATSLDSLRARIGVDLCYPFLAKPDVGSRGEGIVLVQNDDDLQRLDKPVASYVFQNFIENENDFRVFVVGGVAHGVMRRSRAIKSPDVFLNNVSQGGEAEIVTDRKLQEELAYIGTAIAALFDYTIAGVDILQGVDGRLYFMEINSVPEWKGLSQCSPHSVAEHIVDTLVDLGNRTHSSPTIADVRSYYDRRLHFLPVSKQVHFLSRLHLWKPDNQSIARLLSLRDVWWESVPGLIQALQTNAPISVKKSYRTAIASKYSLIHHHNTLFFKLLFDTTIFDGGRQSAIMQVINPTMIHDLRHRLLDDPAALFTLSTAAVNFLYLSNILLEKELPDADLCRHILSVTAQQGLSDPNDDLDARIYFLTHMIIGASAFYSQIIPTEMQQFYKSVLAEVEGLIVSNYFTASLDHKCEFLVCCRLLGQTSAVEPIIVDELFRSFSKHGNFFVNTHNAKSTQSYRQTLATMEHTNVLAIMALTQRGE